MVSVGSSVYDFAEENGRTYHKYKEGKYFLPNDEFEQDRLDLQHQIFIMTLDGKLQLAPIETISGGVRNVLDIGTGTGLWAIEFASMHPTATVIGTDLSPIQPVFVPPNCTFEVEDAEDEWAYSHKFDFIHGRALATCFKDHSTVFASAFKGLNPGGYFELQDGVLPLRCLDNSIAGTMMEKWGAMIMKGASKIGMDWTRSSRYKTLLEDAGFVDVQETWYAWPTNTWAKDNHHKTLGAWVNKDALAAVHGLSVAVLTRGLGMPAEEVDVICEQVKKDICNRRIHSYFPVVCVYGRKPEESYTIVERRTGLG